MNGGRLELAPSKRGEWFAEPKLNGWRVIVHAPTRRAFNRHNEPLSITVEFAAALKILEEISAAHEFEWLDCEGMERRHGLGRGTLVVLDALISGTYKERRERLLMAFGDPPAVDARPPVESVFLIPSFPFSEARAVYDQLKGLNQQWAVPYYEGLVAKRGDSLYPFHLRADTEEFPGWVKHRFLK